MNIKGMKIISACLSVTGVVISLAANVIGEKLLDNKIETKVSEALTKK